MFKRIKGKFKNILDKTEEEVLPEEEQEETTEENQETPQEESGKNEELTEENEETQLGEEKASEGEEREQDETAEEEETEKKGFLSRTFGKVGSKKITEDDFEKIWMELEIYLLEINIAYEIVEKIKERLTEVLIGKNYSRFRLKKAIADTMAEEVTELLKNREGDFIKKIEEERENGIVKIMVLGVNGSGKTTTIGKLIKQLRDHGYSSVVAASDTFRAAGIEQLEEHGKKLGFKIIKHSKGSDPAAVSYDAIKHAEAKELDVVIIDTAGRMANNANLMRELTKIQRVCQPNMITLVGDSNAGNDLKEQIQMFDNSIGLDGIMLTKVDTDERPGSIVTTAYTVEKPIFYLGTGQDYEDLEAFDAEKIANKLFENEEESTS